MKKLNIVWSIVVIFTMSFFTVSLTQNILLRSSETYGFYFNDSQAVAGIYTSITPMEMADEISGFMGSWRPEEFQVYEDTGYDLLGIFSEDDGYNMLVIKKLLDIGTLIGIGSFIITCIIYFYFLKDGKKKVLRDRYWMSLGLSIILVAIQSFIVSTNLGRQYAFNILKLRELGEESTLTMLLGKQFMSMSTIFFIVIFAMVCGIITYIVVKLTKPPRIFS